MRFQVPQVAFAITLGMAAGCGSDDVFEPQLASTERLVETAAVARIAGDDQLVAHVTVVGDIDGDGIADAIVSSQKVIPVGQDVGFDSGVYVLYGGSGASGKFDVASLPVLTGGGALVGPVAAVGDIDGDGLADFLVGIGRVPGCGNPEVTKFGDPPEHSGAYLVYGSRTRVTGTTPIAGVAALLRDAAPCTLADGVVSLGDIDGDGKPDFAISRADVDVPAVAYVFYGRGARLTGTLDLAATADAVITTGKNGVSLLGVGDVDGDGHGDFIARAESDGLSQDVRLVRGSATRLTGNVALTDIAQTQFPSDDACNFVSVNLGAALGDLDGDGRDDFSLVSCHSLEHGLFQIAQRVFYGRAGGFPAHIAAGDEDALFRVAPGVSQVASADLDGDGVLDLVVSESQASNSNGAVHVIHGDGRRLSGVVSPADHAITYIGMPQRSTYCDNLPPGCIIEEALGDEVTIGDLTGDHKPDLLINAPTRQIVAALLGIHGSQAGHAYVVSPSATSP